MIHLIFLHVHGFKGPKFIRKLHIIQKLHFILPNIRSNKRIGPHSSEIYEFLFGSLLGDAHAERLPSGGVRFSFKQSIIQKDYLFFKYDYLLERGYVNNNPPVFQKDKLGDSYRFSTYSYSNLLWFYKIFYKNKIKVLPEWNYLIQFLTPLALAIWIMEDGTLKSPGIRIATNCFTKKECEILIEILRYKYNIESSIQKNNDRYQLYIKKESMNVFMDLIKPYFHSSMYYKLGL
jgi:ubiquinol-cytochrome c reductase cytochrome b subunit